MSGFSDPDDSDSDPEDWAQTLDEERLPSNKTQGPLLKPQNTLVQDRPARCPHSRVIVHIDIDCFYAQVEMVRNPSLRDKPLGIQQKNIIVTCNYVARARGLTKLMYLKEAQEKCPDLVIVKGENLTHYRQMSYKVTELFLKHSPLVERLGMDENYVDVTNMVASNEWRQITEHSDFPGYEYGSEDGTEKGVRCSCEERLQIGAHISKFLRDQLFAECGLTSCGGVAHNKLLAKLVGSTHKPNKQTWLPAQQATKLLLSLGECRKIPSIGRSIATKLASLGVTSVSDLQVSSPADLEEELGSRTARLVYDLSVGVDESEVTVTGRPQTMSDEDSFKKCSDLGDARRRTEGLIRSLLVRVYEDGRVPQTVRLTVRNVITSPAYHRVSRQCALPTTVTAKIRQGDTEGAVAGLLQVCMDLLGRLVDTKTHFHLTLINVAVCKLVDSSTTSRGISAFLTRPTAATQVQNQEGSSVTSHNKTSVLDVTEKESTSIDTDTDSFIHESTSSSCDTGSKNSLTSSCNASEIGSAMIACTSNSSENTGSRTASAVITAQSDDLSDAAREQPKGGMKRPLEELGDTFEGTAPRRSFFKEAQLSSQLRKLPSPQRNLFKKAKTENEPDSAEAPSSEDVQCTAGSEGPPGEGTVNRTEPPPGGASEGSRLVPPPGVDPGVFYSLPLDLQVDVVKQYKDNNSQRTMRHSEANNQPTGINLQGNTTPTQNHPKGMGMKEKQVASTSNSKKSIKSFFNKNNSHEGNTKENTDVLSHESHSRIASTSLLEPDSNHDNKVNTPDTPSGGVGVGADIPEDMDREVFLGLPREIQEELRADWRRRLVSKSGTTTPGGATSSGRKQTMGKKLGSQGQGSLERFFKKK